MKFLIRLLLLLPAMSICVPAISAAQPLADRLDRPSRPSLMAERSLLTAIQTVDGHLVMVGESGRVLLRSVSGELRQASVPVDLLLTALSFPDPKNGWAVGHDGVILHSIDGGESWSKQLDGRAISQLMLSDVEAEVARLEVASTAQPEDDRLATALENAHFAFDDVKAGIEHGPSRPLMDVWFRDSNNGWAVGAYGVVLRTVDGGQNWTYVPGLDNPDRLHFNSVLGLADGSLLIAGEGGRLYRSHDNGLHWQNAQVLTDASLYKLLSLSDGRVLAMGFGGTLLVSDDQGNSWQALSPPVKVGLYGGTQLRDGQVLLAGQGGMILSAATDLRFHVWQAPAKAPWLGVSELRDGVVALVGSGGLVLIPRMNFGEIQP